jgi:hypothetical protein
VPFLNVRDHISQPYRWGKSQFCMFNLCILFSQF